MNESAQHRDALPPGTRVQQFEFVEVLGRGGFGITYRGWDTKLGITVAIKEYMPSEIAVREPDGTVYPRTDGNTRDYQWGLDRFLEEARKLARFNHPGIVPVRHFFEDFGTAYIVMEYLEGRTLYDLYQAEGTLSEERLLGLLAPILVGLEQVHSAGFLHCDIKPGNIILRDGETPVLIDFGAAQVAAAEHSRMVPVVMPGYSPLEQYGRSARGQGPWTDIYAVGAVLYRGMTGEVPSEALARAESDDLVPVARAAKRRYGKQLTEAVDWALRMRGAERPQSIDEWCEVLEGGAPVPGGVAGERAEPPFTEPRGGWRWPVVVVVAPAVVLAVAAAAWWWIETDSHPPPVVSVGVPHERMAAEVRELLGRGDFTGARARLGEVRAAGLDDAAHAELEAAIDRAEAKVAAARELEALVAEVRARLARAEYEAARQALDEARAAGLDDAAHAELEAAIDEPEAAQLLAECEEQRTSERWEELRQCARRVLAMNEDHAGARELEVMGARRLAWNAAEGASSVEGYHEFRQKYRGHFLARLAGQKLAKMEDAYWEWVEATNTRAAYRRYLEIYPRGKYAAQARGRT